MVQLCTEIFCSLLKYFGRLLNILGTHPQHLVRKIYNPDFYIALVISRPSALAELPNEVSGAPSPGTGLEGREEGDRATSRVGTWHSAPPQHQSQGPQEGEQRLDRQNGTRGLRK